MKKLPVYSKNKMKGNVGEAIAQYVLSTFSLVHKIDGSNDVGNDFICELVRDQSPTNLLFYVQVKYTKDKPVIKKETLNYWKGSPIPVYVFWIQDDKQQNFENIEDFSELESKLVYKKFTYLLHKNIKQNEVHFKKFSKYVFLQDLMNDYARTLYVRGFTPIIHVKDFINSIDKENTSLREHKFNIEDVIPEYSKEIISIAWMNLLSLADIMNNKQGEDKRKIATEAVKLALSLVSNAHKFKYAKEYTHLLSLKESLNI